MARVGHSEMSCESRPFVPPTIAPVIAVDLNDWKEGLAWGRVDVTFIGFRTERDVYLGDAIGQIAGSATGIGVTVVWYAHMESPYVDGTKFGLNSTLMNINLEGNFDFIAPEETRELLPRRPRR